LLPVLQTIEPSHNIVLFILGNQRFYGGIAFEYGLGVFGEPLLNLSDPVTPT
jgi:hypothetical protein